MSNQIQAGQVLVAGTGQGQLNQYYGLADTTQTTVTAASYGNLSNVYTIPGGEADYAGVAYELSCSGQATWGSTQQELFFSMSLNNSQFGSGSFVAATAFAVNANLTWKMVMSLTCADGISAWWADMAGVISTQSAVLPGTAAQNSVPLVSSNSAAKTALISSSITVAVQAKWNSTSGAPTISCFKTQFRKVA